jgi:hypothetical protein
MDWIDLAYYRDRWQASVNTVMNLWAPQNMWVFFTSSENTASQEAVMKQASQGIVRPTGQGKTSLRGRSSQHICGL